MPLNNSNFTGIQWCQQLVWVTRQQSGFWLVVQFGSVSDLAKNLPSVVLAGLLPGQDINPWVFGRGGTAPPFDFTVLSTLAQL